MKRIFYAVLTAGLMVFASCTNNADTPAKYIFLFIGDGMGNSQVAVAESYMSYNQGSFYGEQLCFTQFPVFGTCTSYSHSSRVTDSAASGTAIATGTKTDNGRLGTDPQGNFLYSYAKDFQEMGYNIGIMSSVPVNHATPGAFYGHVDKRGDYWKIITQIPEAGYKFYGGFGFLNDSRHSHLDPEAYLSEQGYTVAYGQQEFNERKADSEHMVFLSSPRGGLVGNYVSYALDTESVLLKDMVSNALEYMGDQKPFFIMCEGGEIDWEAHSNRTIPMVIAIQKMDDAIKRAYEFYLAHPDETLIVVTADHETGGVSVGSDQSGYSVDWSVLINDWNTHGLRESAGDNVQINNASGFAWTSTHHTGAPVPVYALGKGAEKFSGRMDNTEFRSKFLCK